MEGEKDEILLLNSWTGQGGGGRVCVYVCLDICALCVDTDAL